MSRIAVAYTHRLEDTLARLAKPGLLLAATKSTGESNVMTIGWGSVGIVWGKPVFTVLVRPSRYTFEFIEESGEFTISVPTIDMERYVALCGTRSGRDMDKFAGLGRSVSPGRTVRAVSLDSSPMVYECKVVHHNDVIPAHLAADIEARSYRGKDYHRVYFGEITGVFAFTNY
ncbi:MAG: flavin reductase family protein [Anaerolineae bacterium]|jgi:flavin reductase (DIM6/NTAB) family NADH-FMN oxidoreductase RutF